MIDEVSLSTDVSHLIIVELGRCFEVTQGQDQGRNSQDLLLFLYDSSDVDQACTVPAIWCTETCTRKRLSSSVSSIAMSTVFNPDAYIHHHTPDMLYPRGRTVSPAIADRSERIPSVFFTFCSFFHFFHFFHFFIFFIF